MLKLMVICLNLVNSKEGQEYLKARLLGKNRNSAEYKMWCKTVLENSNKMCAICSKVKNLRVHHIKSWRNYRELRFVVSNGQILCHKCHTETNNYGGRSIANCN